MSVTLTVGSLIVELIPRGNWIVDKITRRGVVVCGQFGTPQATVLRIDGRWAGSHHENTELIGASLIVDGEEKPLLDGSTYTGNKIVFQRETIIANAYRFNSTMTISDNRIDKTVSLRGLDETKNCEVCYGFMGSRENRLTDYAAFGKDGKVLYSGKTDKDDLSYVFLDNAVAVTQYDPIAGEGVLSVCTSGLGLKYFIWDTNDSNVLFARFYGAEGPASPQNLFEMSQSTLFFDSSPGNWQSDSVLLLKKVLGEPRPLNWPLILGAAAVGAVALLILFKMFKH